MLYQVSKESGEEIWYTALKTVTEYYYLFSVFKDNKIIEKISVNDASDYGKVFKDLSIKMKE